MESYYGAKAAGLKAKVGMYVQNKIFQGECFDRAAFKEHFPEDHEQALTFLTDVSRRLAEGSDRPAWAKEHRERVKGWWKSVEEQGRKNRRRHYQASRLVNKIINKVVINQPTGGAWGFGEGLTITSNMGASLAASSPSHGAQNPSTISRPLLPTMPTSLAVVQLGRPLEEPAASRDGVRSNPKRHVRYEQDAGHARFERWSSSKNCECGLQAEKRRRRSEPVERSYTKRELDRVSIERGSNSDEWDFNKKSRNR